MRKNSREILFKNKNSLKIIDDKKRIHIGKTFYFCIIITYIVITCIKNQQHTIEWLNQNAYVTFFILYKLDLDESVIIASQHLIELDLLVLGELQYLYDGVDHASTNIGVTSGHVVENDILDVFEILSV